MNHVYYWKGAEGAQTLLDEHRETIHRLLSGDYPHSDLEKLRGNHQHKLYSFRINQVERLLFTTRTLDGKHYLHVLEYLPTHDYQKSRFLKREVLGRYLNTQTAPTFEILTTPEDKPAFELSAAHTPLQSIALDFFNKQFIQLHGEQQDIINQSLPLIVNGVSGSGKTYIALSVLAQFISNHTEHESARILYVTQQANLVNTIKEHWDAFQPATHGVQIDFLTYNELLAQRTALDASTHNMSHYTDWLNKQKKSSIDIEADVQFNEFRLCTAYDKDQYRALGQSQSNVPVTQRDDVYRQYESYQTYLAQHNIVEPVFYRFDAKPTYALIVVDEAQNLALGQLNNIHQLAINQAILYCMDPQQNLVDQAPIRQLLRQLHWGSGGAELPSVELNRSYRCAAPIIGVVNTLLQAKHDILGKIDKTETDLTHDPRTDNGYVALTTPKNIRADHQAILNRCSTNHFAVVTHEHLREEAQDLFQTALVFTVEEIQGLEYHTVVVYKLLSDETSKTNLKIIHKPLCQPNTHKHTKEIKEEHTSLAPWFNGLYIAYTRAQHTLLICDDVPKNRNGLIQLLQNKGATATTNAASISTTILPATDWVAEAQRLHDKGHTDIAEKIQKRHVVEERTAHTVASPTIIKSQPTEARALDIFKRFAEKGFLVKWINDSDFIATLFDTSFYLQNKKANLFTHKNKKANLFTHKNKKANLFTHKNKKANLFTHIAQSTDHAARFNIVIGLFATSVMTEEFISRALTQEKLPDNIAEKILNHLVVTDTNMLNEPKIKESLLCYVKKNLDTISCHLVLKEELHSLIEAMLHHHILDDSTTAALIENLSLVEPQLPFPGLFVLAASNIRLFANLLNRHPNFPSVVPTDIWSFTVLSPDTPLHHTSILYWLARHPDGRAILTTLAEKHPDIINAIPPGAWSLARTNTAAGIEENMSALYCLAASPDGNTLLKTLIHKYPDIINAIPAVAWSLPRTHQAGDYANRSALYWLTASNDGLDILKNIMNDLPEVIQNIPAEAWGLACTHQAGADENASPLYWLSRSVDGRILLKTLIEEHPTIINTIPSNAWSLARTHQAGAYENMSAIYWLAKTPDGRAILKILIENHPDVIHAMSPKAWSLAITHQAGPTENTSALYYLALYPDGRSILANLIDSHPDVISAIPPEAWILPRTEAAGEYENSTPLFLLSATTDGRAILQTLIDRHPNVIEAMPSKGWNLALTPQTREKENTSPLYHLAGNSDGRILLATLIDKHPTIIDAITPHTWSLAQTSQAGAYENVSSLFSLASTPDGRAILTTLIDKYPHIISNIPIKAWTSTLMPKAGEYENASPLFSLASTPDGCAILTTLIDKHPHIIRNIPLTAWTSTLTPKAGVHENASPLYCLSTSTEGSIILNKLIESLPDIAKDSGLIAPPALNTLTQSSMTLFNTTQPTGHDTSPPDLELAKEQMSLP